MAADFLDTLFKYCDLDTEHKEYIFKTLFKYKADPVINALCESINSKAAEHTRFITTFQEVDNKIEDIDKPFPLIVLCPNELTSLRVYPNILLSTHSNLDKLTSLACTEALKDFLVTYEADMADDKRKQKWQPLDRAKALFETYIDMPTARALTRFIFTDGKRKDNQVRDFADTIDTLRKPMELTFADTPEEFAIMYGSGPHSCMAFSAEGKENWKFFNEHNLCPASWYAYYPYTRGAYALKNKKVVARSVLFKDTGSDKWLHGRLYGTTTEITQKFQQSLAEMSIAPLSVYGTHTPPAGTSFEMPGIPIKEAKNTFGCPWPYFDNTPREPKDWGAKYDAERNIFTIQFKPHKLNPIYNRTGHLRSTDYVTLECSNCGGVIPRNTSLLETEGGQHTLCSDNCAVDMGYIKAYNGAGTSSYKRPIEEFISIYGSDFTKFTTLKAAYDNYYTPVIEENDIIPEETDYQVSCTGKTRITAGAGVFMLANLSGMSSEHREFNSNKVPFNLRKALKLVAFNTEAELLTEA